MPGTVVSLDELAEYLSPPGGDVAVLGSATLTGALLRAKLVDELRLMVNPILLGSGRKRARMVFVL